MYGMRNTLRGLTIPPVQDPVNAGIGLHHSTGGFYSDPQYLIDTNHACPHLATPVLPHPPRSNPIHVKPHHP